MKYYTVVCDDCNLAHTEINIAILRSGVPAHRFTKEFLSPLSLNVQNLDVGLALELYFRRLNVKYATCSQIFKNAFRSRKSAMFLLYENQVLSLARPNFLTGAIIETRSQASLLAPPDFCNIINQFGIRAHSNIDPEIFIGKSRLRNIGLIGNNILVLRAGFKLVFRIWSGYFSNKHRTFVNLGVGRTAIEAHDGSDKRTEEMEKRTEIDDNANTK